MDAPGDAVRLEWTPRAGENADAHLARLREVGGSSARALSAIVLAVAGGLLLLAKATFSIGLAFLAVAAVIAFGRLTSRLLRQRYAAQFAANPTLSDPITLELDDNGLRSATSRISSARTWAAFSSWTDAPEAAVLSTSDLPGGHLLVLPHRATDDPTQVATLRSLLRRHLGPPLGEGPGPHGRALPWVARAAVVVSLVGALAVGFGRTHERTGEWRPWPAEAPPRVSYLGVGYVRVGEATRVIPPNVPGVAYTSGGGLVLAAFGNGAPPELWVLDHRGVVRHYVATAAQGPTA